MFAVPHPDRWRHEVVGLPASLLPNHCSWVQTWEDPGPTSDQDVKTVLGQKFVYHSALDYFPPGALPLTVVEPLWSNLFGTAALALRMNTVFCSSVTAALASSSGALV